MAVSNSANGGTTRFELVIQVVATSDTSYTLRAVIYLLSLNVQDSVNNLSVGGNWSRSGALALGGVYNGVPVWSQDIVVGRASGSATNVSVSASWSGVEYWGTTLSASESYSVPARPVSPPSPPSTPSVDSITGTSLRVAWWGIPASNGGAGIDMYRIHVGTDPSFPGGTFTAKEATVPPVSFTGLTPGTTYYAMVIARNTAGLWSGWSGLRQVSTLNYPSAPGTPYVQGSLQPDQVTVNFTGSASNGGSAIDHYHIQLLNENNTLAQEFNIAGGPRTFTGLTPGTTYKVRVRSHNSVGFSAFSGLMSFQTLSGAKIRVGGAWVDGIGHVRVSGAWKVAKVWKRVGGAWVL